jgi:hypothetical protein
VIGGSPRAGSDAAEVAWVNATQFARLESTNALSPQLADTLREWRVLPIG